MSSSSERPTACPDDVLTQPVLDNSFNRFSAESALGLPVAMQFDSLISLIRPVFDHHISLLRETQLQHRIASQELSAQRDTEFRLELHDLETGHAEVLRDLREELRETRKTISGQRDTEFRYTQQIQVLEDQLREASNVNAGLRDTESRYTQQIQVFEDQLREGRIVNASLHDAELRSAQQAQDLREQLTRMIALHSAEVNRMQATHEGGHRLMFSQLLAANGIAKEAGARLEGYLLRQPIETKQPVAGSKTRAAIWDNLKLILGNRFNQTLPVNPATAELMKRAIANVSLFTGTHDFQLEPETYPAICDLLRTGLNHNDNVVSVHDTSRLPYLNGYKPDLTISLPGIVEPDSQSVYIIVEVKLGALKSGVSHSEIKNPGTSSDFGQLYDYLLAVQHDQVGRRTCVGIVTDINRTYVVTVGNPKAGSPVTHYNAEPIHRVLAYIRDTVLKDGSYLPPDLGFSDGIGRMHRRLGNPRHCVVGEFDVPVGSPGTVMAVKLTTIKSREPYFLESFRDDPSRPSCIPHLVHNVGDLELGIIPVGRQLRPDTLLNQVQTRQIMTDVIAATTWLHERGIVHRDIRCENIIILTDGHAVLIDYNCSYDLRWSIPTNYLGGYICIPPTHLPGVCTHGDKYMYIPSRADDCFAIVLLAYTILFPQRFANFRASEIETPGSLEGPAMINFWNELQCSPLWLGYIMIAHTGNVTGLGKMNEIFY